MKRRNLKETSFWRVIDYNFRAGNPVHIDVYFVYALTNYRQYLGTTAFPDEMMKHQLNLDDITGDLLMNRLISQLRKIVNNSILYSGYNLPTINIKRDPPYRHAIPIVVRYKGYTYNVDCIPAIKVNNTNDLIIPHFSNVTKINPTKEENGLSRINKKHQGKPTKLIRLIKYWNNAKGHVLKSYLIERLVQKIFKDKPMNTWVSALKIFFENSIYILRNRINMENKVYTHQSILDEYPDERIEEMIHVLQESARYTQEGDWQLAFD